MASDQLYGYAGRLLRVDIGSGKATREKLAPEVMRKFGGGVGYAAKLLYDELKPKIGPLGPSNKVVFATGPLTGTTAPSAGSIQVCFKSPLTGIWAESRSGGEWGHALKKAGYDFLVIEGKAKEPALIVITDDKVELRSAGKLAGKTSSRKDKLIKEELNDSSFETAVIGPSGEKLVRFASVMFGERAAGRCGGGAVMGAKNLLGVAVKGTGKIPIAHPDEFQNAVKECNKKLLEKTGGVGMAPGGTTGDIPTCDSAGDSPTKNWRSNSWGIGDKLYDHFKESNQVRAGTCYGGCVLRCKRIVQVTSGKYITPVHEGGEYETISAFTFFVQNEDVDAAVHADYLCNEYGLDTISTGAVIAFAMDCYDQGIISKKDTGGLDLSWGNSDALVKLVKLINERKGIGNILAEGVKRAAEKLGKGADKLAIHVKGLEGPAHDPRFGKTLALSYGTANRGMCHIHPLDGLAWDGAKNSFGMVPYGLPDPTTVNNWAEEDKGKAAKLLQDCGMLPDILGTCKFHLYNGIGPADYAVLMTKLTGWDMSAEELLSIGERVFNLQRMFNVREGISRKDDYIPQRILTMPEFGKFASSLECTIKDYEKMLDEYYQARGWSKDGVPPCSEMQSIR